MVSERERYDNLITSVVSRKNTHDFVNGVWKGYSAFQAYLPSQDPWRVSIRNSHQFGNLQKTCSKLAVTLRACAPEMLESKLSGDVSRTLVFNMHGAAYAALINSLVQVTGQPAINYSRLEKHMREFANAMERLKEFNDVGFERTTGLLRILYANIHDSDSLAPYLGFNRSTPESAFGQNERRA